MPAHSHVAVCVLEVTSLRHMGHGKSVNRPMQPGQAHMCPQGCSTTLATASQQITHSASSTSSVLSTGACGWSAAAWMLLSCWLVPAVSCRLRGAMVGAGPSVAAVLAGFGAGCTPSLLQTVELAAEGCGSQTAAV